MQLFIKFFVKLNPSEMINILSIKKVLTLIKQPCNIWLR